ncbi:30S ribosomal protein S1 [Rubricoccus marinus]|uniref:Small ribosomal subunit protein bS1 n=1 Tax=Rubricoccus marinus TaxID=716817 RepID=A0A259TWX7_9BACT|nr:30S ribosomal protein S1 [Rubricoccus marinus]OZC02253.1 30S ribosomal protein S1 [Rubricoccus marinus]
MADDKTTPVEETSETTTPENEAPATAPEETPAASGDGATADAPEAAGEESLIERATGAAKKAAAAAADAVEDAAEAVSKTAKSVADRVEHAVEDTVERVRGEKPAASAASGDGANAPITGYTGLNLGRTITLDELNSMDSGASGDGVQLSDNDFISMVDSSMSDVDEHSLTTGTVVGMTDKEIVVDIGFKSDGVVAKNEFNEVPEIGEEIQVYVEWLEDRRGQLSLSRNKAIDRMRWDIIEEAHENGTVLEGEIVKRIKGGMIVNLLGSEAFLPGSQVDVRPVRDFEAYLGKTMEFKVVKTNPQNGNVVISHKALVEKDLMEQRKLILDSLEVGQVLEGTVKNIVNFGAFVDLGGVDGLLHITDISWGRVGHPSEVLELDQKIKIVVLDYDKERQRISLGYKQLLGHPWDNIHERLTEGMELDGKVVSITDYGAFVELERGIEGLVHISEMSWTEHVKHPTQRVQLGQAVQVKILKIDDDDKKISLGMKQLEPDPWEGLLSRFPVGTVTRGKVRNITTFGAFVELEPGIDGLVHVSDLSWTRRVKHPSEVVKKGQELDVIVIDIDVANRRISLGHKQVSTDPWSQYADVYAEGSGTTGTVTDTNAGGVVVELPLGAEAFIPASHLARQGNPGDAYAAGDELELTVIRLDREDREIVCSETAQRRAAERAEQHAERMEKTKKIQEERRAVSNYQRAASGPATLGELSGLAALRAQMEEAEASGEPSESESKAVEAEQPEEGELTPTVSSAASDLEGSVGTGNRSEDEPTIGEEATAQRPQEQGATPTSEKSQAAVKSGDLQTEGVAGEVEAAVEDETPNTADAKTDIDRVNSTEESPEVPDVLSKTTSDIVGDANDEAGESAEMGKADVTVKGDDAEDVADKAE